MAKKGCVKGPFFTILFFALLIPISGALPYDFQSYDFHIEPKPDYAENAFVVCLADKSQCLGIFIPVETTMDELPDAALPCNIEGYYFLDGGRSGKSELYHVASESTTTTISESSGSRGISSTTVPPEPASTTTSAPATSTTFQVSTTTVPEAHTQDQFDRFSREYSESRMVYDYEGLLRNAAELENKLKALVAKNINIYVATFGAELEHLRLLVKGFSFDGGFIVDTGKRTPVSPVVPPSRGTTTIPSQIPGGTTTTVAGETPESRGISTSTIPPQHPGGTTSTIPAGGRIPPPSTPIEEGYGSILSYADVMGDDNGFTWTGFAKCHPDRSPDEPNWREIWESHACMAFPEDFEYILVNYSWIGKAGEGMVYASIETNAYVGERYKQGGMWKFKDRDGYTYDVAPLDPNHPDYTRLNSIYNNPEYSIHNTYTSTIAYILSEKYGAAKRIYGGRKGYPLPACTKPRKPEEPDIVVPEGGSVTITPPHGIPRSTGYASAGQTPAYKVTDVQAQYGAGWYNVCMYSGPCQGYFRVINVQTPPESALPTDKPGFYFDPVARKLYYASAQSPTTTGGRGVASTTIIARASTTSIKPSTGIPIHGRACRALILLTRQGYWGFIQSGCGVTISEGVVAEIDSFITKKDYDGAVSFLVSAVEKEYRGGMPLDECSQLFNEGAGLMGQNQFEAAFEKFTKVVSNCKNPLKARALYMQAEIRNNAQKYIEAAVLAERAFNETKADTSLKELAKASLKLAILASGRGGDCPNVLRLWNIWESKGFDSIGGRDNDVASAVSSCGGSNPRSPPSAKTSTSSQPQTPGVPTAPIPPYSPTPSVPGTEDFKGTFQIFYNQAEETFRNGNYEATCGQFGKVNAEKYLGALTVDRALASNILSLLIKCTVRLGNCVAARGYLSVYERDFGASPGLSGEVSGCRESGLSPPSFSYWDFPYPQPKGTEEENIRVLLGYGWDMQNKGDYKGANFMALYIAANYFSTGSPNPAKYPDLYRSHQKLYIMSGMLLGGSGVLHSTSCQDYGQIHYSLVYRQIWGMDEDIERAWNKCEGKSHKQVSGRCSTSWPTGEGSKVGHNTITDACELFSTAHPSMDFVIADAERCCVSGSDSSPLCSFALSHSTLSDPSQNQKRCKGIYIIKAVGEYAKYIKGYFQPEVNCDGMSSDVEQRYKGRCDSSNSQQFNANARALPCRETRDIFWGSDTDMSKNNCNIVEPPAYATLTILQTGTCADYSNLVTTLLRKAGYEANEVFSVDQTIHATNLVKLPGDTKYHHVDTTNNKVGIVFDGVFPGRDYNKVGRWGCFNDMGWFRCPDNSMVYETFGY